MFFVGGLQLTTVNPLPPGFPNQDVELDRCDDDIILIYECFVVNVENFRPVGDECLTTSTFASFCEATVLCRFTQTEFRPAVVDVCGSDYDQAQITFIYVCLPGKRSLTLRVV